MNPRWPLSHLKVDPPAECVPDAKIAFDQPVRETNCRSLQADRVGVVRDTKKQANSEGKVQRYTTRADRYRRIDEEAWQQITTLLVLRGRAHSTEDEDQGLAMKKTYRE